VETVVQPGFGRPRGRPFPAPGTPLLEVHFGSGGEGNTIRTRTPQVRSFGWMLKTGVTLSSERIPAQRRARLLSGRGPHAGFSSSTPGVFNDRREVRTVRSHGVDVCLSSMREFEDDPRRIGRTLWPSCHRSRRQVGIVWNPFLSGCTSPSVPSHPARTSQRPSGEPSIRPPPDTPHGVTRSIPDPSALRM
jgi:hypothetical protein